MCRLSRKGLTSKVASSPLRRLLKKFHCGLSDWALTELVGNDTASKVDILICNHLLGMCLKEANRSYLEFMLVPGGDKLL